MPTLTPYLAAPERATGAAVVVYPGGGYGALAGHEGEGYARWLNGLGCHAFVCRYRLGSKGYRHPVMLWDAARAVRTVRARAAEWQVDPGRVGVIGSSAGGHLASTILTHWDAGDPGSEDPVERRASRPDFGILCYPVISMAEPFTHKGSRRNLLGADPEAGLLELLSNERQVDGLTPPTFLWHTADDGAVSVRNSYAFADALARAGVEHEVFVTAHGRHGLGLGVRDPGGRTAAELLPWTRACARWLAATQGTRPWRAVVGAPMAARLLAEGAESGPAAGSRDRDGGGAEFAAVVVSRIGDRLALRLEADADASKLAAAQRCRLFVGDEALGSVVGREVVDGMLLAVREQPFGAPDVGTGATVRLRR